MLCSRGRFEFQFFRLWTRKTWRCAALLCGAAICITSSPVFGQSAEQIRLYQDMLTWTTEYEGLIDGKAGRETDKAIRKFQERMGYPVTGSLSEAQAEELVKQGNAKKRRAGFKQTPDNDAGISIGIPVNFVSKPTKTKWGKHWYNKKAGLAIDSLRFVDITLDQLYERLIKVKNRKITYQRKLDDWFVIAALERDSAGKAGDALKFSLRSGVQVGVNCPRSVGGAARAEAVWTIDATAAAPDQKFDAYRSQPPGGKCFGLLEWLGEGLSAGI